MLLLKGGREKLAVQKHDYTTCINGLCGRELLFFVGYVGGSWEFQFSYLQIYTLVNHKILRYCFR